MGGDGMQIQIDKRNPNIVLLVFSLEIITESIVPQTNASTFRQSQKDENHSFNWQTPILLSSTIKIFCIWDPIFLHRSMNQQTWTAISPDLTNGTKEGNVAFGTIATISESQLQFVCCTLVVTMD
jgi:hypothetical protein